MVEVFASNKTSQLPPQDQEIIHRYADDYSEVLKAENPATNVCSAYLPKPLGFKFDSQEQNEHILLVLRQHPISQLKRILAGMVLLVLPMLVSSTGVLNYLPGSYQMSIFIMWFILVFGYFFAIFLTWFFSVYIITDERIIDVDFYSLIHKDVSSAKLDRIEDVSAVTGGAIQSMFDFGKVSIQTAGATMQLDFENVPHPARITKLLNELQLEEEREKIEGRVR